MQLIEDQIQVLQVMRRPLAGYQSFERLFEAINRHLPGDILRQACFLPYHTEGLIRRMGNALYALTLRGKVIHITGDVHYVTLGLIGKNVVLTIHDLAAVHANCGMKRKLIEWFQYRIPLRLATATTAISASVRDELVQVFGVKPDAIHVIPNCIAEGFSHTPRAWPDRPVVLMIGTKLNKNLPRMMTALKNLNVDVRIVGQLSDPQRQALQATGVAFRELGRISDSDVIVAYRQCDLLAFASTYEGFGLPILEAQTIGRPVLTADLPVLCEVAGEKGACFVDPLNIESIRAGFERLLSDPVYRDQLVAKGLENARRFSPEATAAAYTKIYREVAA